MDVHLNLVHQYYNFSLSYEMQSWGISVFTTRKELPTAISLKAISL
ncbi:Bgt-51767 [Blumeria graminis f. sp. tritici]|uniref:Bgt-51767 n=1 Tax=Blumeria graminis f. sp. tritici TaxID=62690 RepID=A0A9X9QBL4_BLUGR|nr:Bgt-51767 [Blumeria graminis f. sp. tritici]